MLIFLISFIATVVLAIILSARFLLHRSNRVLIWITAAFFCTCWISLLWYMGNLHVGALLTGLLFLLLSVGLGGLVLIRKIIRKPEGKAAAAGGSFLVLGLVAILAGTYTDLSDFLLIVGLLCFLAVLILMAAALIRKLIRKTVRSCITEILVLFTTGIALWSISFRISENQRRIAYENRELNEPVVQQEYDFEVKDGETPIEIVEYRETPGIGENAGSILVCDSEHLNLLFNEEPADAEACKTRIRSNPGIPEPFRDYFCDFVDRMVEHDSEIPLTILYHNLKTLKVEEAGRTDYLMKSLSPSSLGVYRNDENAIYIPEGTEYVEGEFGFQVLLHEFCHAARTCWIDGSYSMRAEFEASSDSSLLSECMNTVYSCSLLRYDERDLAYQIPSNYLRIMLECMDNYTISDYFHHGDTWFYAKLDEAAGYTNYARTIWKLINLQRSDWNSDTIDIAEKEYEPIYDFLCRLYYGKYGTEDMTEEDAIALADELAERAFYDAPEGYKLNTDRFYENIECLIAEKQT